MKWLAIAVVAVVLSGCQNAGYIMETYNVPKKTVKSERGTFVVFDRPDLGKMMTTPSVGTLAGPAFVQGATFGAVKLDPPVQEHQAVARRFFRETGRNCTIRTSSEILRPEYEHTYSCR